MPKLKHDKSDIPSVLLSDQQVAAMLGTSRATIWRRANEGTFPRPVKIGPATRWLRSEIEEMIATAVAERDSGVHQ